MQVAAPSSSSSSGQDSEPRMRGEGPRCRPRGLGSGTPVGSAASTPLETRDSVDTCVQQGQEGREVWGEGRTSGEHQPGARWSLTL